MLQCTLNESLNGDNDMYDAYVVTTGSPDQWTFTDSIEEAEAKAVEYSEEFPHEDVTIYENKGAIL